MRVTPLPHQAIGAAVLVLAAAFAALPAAAQQKVGITGAVNPDVTGTPLGGAARQIVIGQEIVYNEHITTSAGGQAQILFLDESSLSLGPNSDLVVDEFVYDPRTGTGKLTMTAARGVLRYIGGKLSKQENAVTMHTSSATIGVRGGVFLLTVAPAGNLDVVALNNGGPRVTGQSGAAQTLSRNNYMVSVAGPGAAATVPAPAPGTLTTSLLSQVNIRGH